MFEDRKDVLYMAKNVSNKEIADNSYNLSVSHYVEKEDVREEINIKELNANIEKIVQRENELRDQIRHILREIATIF